MNITTGREMFVAMLEIDFSSLLGFKGALCRFGEEIQMQNFNIYCINEVIIQTQNIYFFK